MNKVILMGRLTRDPELRQTQSGVTSCRFTVAIDRRTDKTTGDKVTDFISCTAWGQTGEMINRYFNKGSMICIEGSLRTGSYPDKNHSDVTHYTTDVWVDRFEFTGSKAEANSNNIYQNGGYNNAPQNNYNNNYSAPPQQAAPQQPAANDSMSYGNLSDFEEILSDGDVPF